MSLTQQLLVRALVAWFWKEPYTQQLIAWGTQLHDRFMLPHFVGRDFGEVLDDLKRAGYPFEADGSLRTSSSASRARDARTMPASISNCARPSSPGTCWARKARRGGTARYVDSSVERVQVKVKGVTSRVISVTCNGRRCRCTPPGTPGGVCGRRPIPGVAAAVVPASDDSGACALGLRYRGHLDGALDGGVHVSRFAPGRPHVRDIPGERQRSRGTARLRDSSSSAIRRDP